MNKNQVINTMKIIIVSALVTGSFIFLQSVTNNFGFSGIKIEITQTPIFSVLLILIIADIIYGHRIKKAIKRDNFCDDEKSAYAKYQKKIETLLSFTTGIIILNMVTVGYFDPFITGNHTLDLVLNPFMFILIALLGMYGEVLYINIVKSVEPLKNNDVDKLDFNLRYIKSLDEFELKKAGEVALKSSASKPMIYSALFFVGIFADLHRDYFLGLFAFVLIDHIVSSVNAYKLK